MPLSLISTKFIKYLFSSVTETNNLKVTLLSSNHQEAIHAFLSTIFTKEQYIPADQIPIDSEESYWWGVIGPNNEIFGAVAIWKEKNEWHWGRFAIHPKLRGRGLGKELAKVSLIETFELEIEQLTIDARDVTITLIEKFGGVICGKTTRFYSENITPMKLEKKNFDPEQK